MQQQPQVSPELQQKYMATKNTYKQLVKAIIALEDEKKEHLWGYKVGDRSDQDFRAGAEVLQDGGVIR